MQTRPQKRHGAQATATHMLAASAIFDFSFFAVELFSSFFGVDFSSCAAYSMVSGLGSSWCISLVEAGGASAAAGMVAWVGGISG